MLPKQPVLAASASVGSAIDALIDHGIDIRAKPADTDSGRAPGGVGNGFPRHELVGSNRPQLRDRRAVACDDERSACLRSACSTM